MMDRIPVHLQVTSTPEHMQEDDYFDPAWYEQGECMNCHKPIYRYWMDLLIEWKHFNHSTYCSTLRAKPKESACTAG